MTVIEPVVKKDFMHKTERKSAIIFMLFFVKPDGII